jgi:hypothetical protein
MRVNSVACEGQSFDKLSMVGTIMYQAELMCAIMKCPFITARVFARFNKKLPYYLLI